MKSKMSVKRQFIGLIIWLILTFIAAGIGSIATMNAGEFYLQLNRPEWAPPATVFGPVWTMLYILMGVAAWIVWRIEGFSAARLALSFHFAQLAANALWSWLFFRWNLGALAFAEVLLLWFLIAVTIILFWRKKPLAGALLIPYILWVSYASALNYVLWQLNPDILG